MLSDGEKKELLACARSESLRRDFAILRENSAARAPRTLDDLIAFLAMMNAAGRFARRSRPLDAGRCRL